MKTNTLLALFCLFAFCSCKKDDPIVTPTPVVPFPMHAQARSTDIFGHPLSDSMPCIKKMTDPGDATVAAYFYYNADGLMTKSVYKLNGVGQDSVSFNYDGQHRLTSIRDYDNYSLTYGTDNKLASFTTTSLDVFYVTYPTANKVVVSKADGNGGLSSDTLIFDANYNEVSLVSWYNYPGYPPMFSGSTTTTYNSSLNSPFYASAIEDYYLLQSIVGNYPPSELSGNNVIASQVLTDPSGSRQTSLIDSQHSSSYPTYLKFRLQDGIYTEDYKYGFEYNCN